MMGIVYALYALIGLSLFRLAVGPTLYDRLAALHLISALVVLLLCVHAIRLNLPFYLDVALIYALLSFGETVAFARLRPRPAAEEAA